MERQSLLWRRAEVLRAGGLPKLIALLSEGDADAQRHATAALWPLCDDEFSVQAEIVAQGGVPPLLRILLHSPVAEAQETAGSILTELALSPAPNGVAERARDQVKAALGSLAEEDPDAAEMLPATLREAIGLLASEEQQA